MDPFERIQNQTEYALGNKSNGAIWARNSFKSLHRGRYCCYDWKVIGSIPNPWIVDCCSVLNPGWMSEWTLVMTLSGHKWFRTCFRNILLLLFITEWTEALQISVSPASGQMGHIRPECTGKGMKTSQRHLERPHLSLTDAGGEPVHIWDNPGCLTFPPPCPRRGERAQTP